MNEYKKRLAQQGSQKQNIESAALQSVNGIPNSVLNDVFAGKRRATNEMMGHRVDPAPSVLARMSQAFGMDFSNVQVYRSDAMNGTGMQGMAQGNKVVLGSDVDLNTQEGQAILGHEFSHIRAQSMGIGGGSGLLQDAALEHQADNEGLLAARGMNISGESMGMSTSLGMAGFEGLTPLGGGMSATAAAPMQAYFNPFNNRDKDMAEIKRIEDLGKDGGTIPLKLNKRRYHLKRYWDERDAAERARYDREGQAVHENFLADKQAEEDAKELNDEQIHDKLAQQCAPYLQKMLDDAGLGFEMGNMLNPMISHIMSNNNKLSKNGAKTNDKAMEKAYLHACYQYLGKERRPKQIPQFTYNKKTRMTDVSYKDAIYDEDNEGEFIEI